MIPATDNAPHLHRARSVRSIMGWVLVALLPAAALQCWFFGPGLLIQFVLASLSGLLAETLALRLRGRALTPLGDLSVLVTAALLALSMPPLAPWWLVSSACAFAILLGKQVFGGLGFNPFNPAMLGYAVLLVSFPNDMTRWLPAYGDTATQLGLSATAHAIFTGELPTILSVDVLSGASPLAAVKSGLSLRQTLDEIFMQPAFGSLAGTGWEWIALALLGGGVLLLGLRIIRWQLPGGVLMGVAGCALVMNLLDPGRHAGVLFHLFAGATMMGAFFIATDPVTAPAGTRGRLVYGLGIGVLIYVIREFGNYHDGVAFAVLLMNLSVPFIDRFTLPRILGEAR